MLLLANLLELKQHFMKFLPLDRGSSRLRCVTPGRVLTIDLLLRRSQDARMRKVDAADQRKLPTKTALAQVSSLIY